MFWFKRNNDKVQLEVESGLNSCKPNYLFYWQCQDQEYAELLVNHLDKKLQEFKEKIAKEAYNYLDAKDVSKLKRELNNRWNSKNNCWK